MHGARRLGQHIAIQPTRWLKFSQLAIAGADPAGIVTEQVVQIAIVACTHESNLVRIRASA